MSTNTGPPDAQQSYFATQRAILVSEIALSMDSVLTNLNRLNRSLEAIIAVGNEFSSVEALWSTFEGVMGNQPEATDAPKQGEDNTGSGTGDEKDS